MCAAASWQRSSTVPADSIPAISSRMAGYSFQRAGLAGNRRFQLDQQIGGGAMHQQLMAAMAIQMHGTDMRAAADRRLLEQRLERRQRTAKHLADMLRQRLAELLQQPRMFDGALEHLQGLRLNDQKHTVRLDRAGGMDRARSWTRRCRARIQQKASRAGLMVRGWLDSPVIHPYPSMVKQNRASAYQCVRVKRVSVQAEFFM